MKKGGDMIVFEEYLYVIIAYFHNNIIIFITIAKKVLLNYELV